MGLIDQQPSLDDPVDDDDDDTSSITSLSGSSRRAFAGSDPADDDESDSTTFDTSTQTLGTTSLGTSTGSSGSDDSGGLDDDSSIEVTTSDPDPDSSSPAGGAGATSAAARFTGQDEEDVDDPIDESQEASDEFTRRMRLAREFGVVVDPAEAVGSIFDDRGVLEAQRREIASAIPERVRDAVDDGGLPIGTIVAGIVTLVLVLIGAAAEVE